MKIRSVAAELFHAGGRRDGHESNSLPPQYLKTRGTVAARFLVAFRAW